MLALFSSNKADEFRLLFGVFAIVMLPFTSPLLFRSVKRRLGKKGVVGSLIIILFVIPTGLSLTASALLKPRWERFRDKSARYHADFAHACDTVLKQHPLGTNATIKIAGTDPSLPKVVHQLYPSEVIVSSNRVFVDMGAHDFGVAWEPEEGSASNVWALRVLTEVPNITVYVVTKAPN